MKYNIFFGFVNTFLINISFKRFKANRLPFPIRKKGGIDYSQKVGIIPKVSFEIMS